MAEITGSSIEIGPLVRFLVSMGKSGDLLVTRAAWQGQLSLDHGRLIAAAVDQTHGLAALEFVAQAFNGASFRFLERPPSLALNLEPGLDALAVFDRAEAAPSQFNQRELYAPTDVPHLVESGAVDDYTPTPLNRAAVQLLVDVDGRRTVRDFAGQHGHLRTLTALGQLHQLGLISLTPSEVASTGFVSAPSPSPAIPETLFQAPDAGIDTKSRVRPRLLPRGLRQRGLSFVRSEILQAVLATGVVILATRSLIENFRVEGTSMQPTFNGGQVLVVNRAAYFHVEKTPLASLAVTDPQGSTSTRYLFGGPRRGDVAVFRAPTEPNTDYIKRIIGLPGDRVLIQHGQVLVNDQPLDEPYVRFPADYTFPGDGNWLVVPDGTYFVLGDNRPDSFDSHFGWVVPVDNLVGQAWIRYWPPDNLGIVTRSGQQTAQAAEHGARTQP